MTQDTAVQNDAVARGDAVATADDRRMTETFGDLSLQMLRESPLARVWRINFLANFYTGPFYRRTTAKHGITRPEFVVLLLLSQKAGLVAKDVVRVTGLPKNSISRAVAVLLEKGLIEREQRQDDRRSKTLVMTAEGAALLAAIIPEAWSRQDAMHAALDADELALLDRLLDKMVYAMPDWALD